MKKKILSLVVLSSMLVGCAATHAAARPKKCVPTWAVVTDVVVGTAAALVVPHAMNVADEPPSDKQATALGLGGFALVFSSGTIWAYKHCKGDL